MPSQFDGLFDRPLVFFGGKGGVGKTTLSQAFAFAALNKGKRIRWIYFDPFTPIPQELKPFALCVDPSKALTEYIELKLSVALQWVPFAKQWLNHRWIHLLAQAAPGISDLLMLGKIWHERNQADTVIVDLPSTGHAIQLFQSALGFERLFSQSLLSKDIKAILQTLHDPTQIGQVIVTLPEEGPLTEAGELLESWLARFPNVVPIVCANRCTPHPGSAPNGNAVLEYMSNRVERETELLLRFNVVPKCMWMPLEEVPR